MNKSKEAVHASAAHVMLEPKSQSAKGNSVFYLRQPGVTKKDFVPREVKFYRLTLIVEYLDVIQDTSCDQDALFRSLQSGQLL